MGRSRTAGRQGIDSVGEAGGTGDADRDAVRLALGLKDPNRPVKLALSKIRRDGGTQPRAALNQETVEEYAEDMREGKKFPPAVVFYDGTDYWLVDGFHRLAAVEMNGDKEYHFVVKLGTQREAVLYSFGVNDEHGLRRNNDDKRRVVLSMLADSEWSQWADREIARQCRVSHGFVGRLRESLDSLDSESSDAGERTYTTKHGGQATMNTQRIREANQQRAKSAAEPPAPPPPAPAPVRPPAAQDEIEIAIMAALTDGDLVWHELLRAVKSTTSGEVEPPAFNQALRTLLDVGQVVPSQHDQAAFALPSATDAENATIGDGAKNAQPDFTWAGSEASVLSGLLDDLQGLDRQQMESDCARMSQKAADRLRREVHDTVLLLQQWEGWLQ